jgi:hypothetical protein
MDIRMANLDIPKGPTLYFPKIAIFHDPKLWGTNVPASSHNDLLMVLQRQPNY